MKKFILFSIILAMTGLLGQSIQTKTFKLADELDDQPYSSSLKGYGIIDLLVKDTLLWAASGYALNKTNDDGSNWQIYTTEQHKSKGGVAAMAYMDAQTLWISTAFDTTASGEDLSAGGGLSYTRDNGSTWTHIPQPVDSVNEERYSPTTTAIQNIVYDIAFIDSTIWIASYGAGLRRSDDMGKTWQVVTTDGNPFNPLNSVYGLNHRAFSLLAENGNLWVGTAQGISRSPDNGQSWERFTSTNQEKHISGNFVVALAYQAYNNTIWAATIEATDTSEVRAVSKTTNGGQTWQVMLEGNFAHNFGFDGPRIYVAADEGLYVSDDAGNNWYEMGDIQSEESREELFFQEYYSAAVQDLNIEKRLWIGTSRGLALTKNNGNTWSIIPAFVSDKPKDINKVYAYPSPFTPRIDGYCQFQIDRLNAERIKIQIFDFSMDKVKTIPIDNFRPKWDGTNDSGDVVANGIYFFRSEVDGKVSWGKIVIIN